MCSCRERQTEVRKYIKSYLLSMHDEILAEGNRLFVLSNDIYASGHKDMADGANTIARNGGTNANNAELFSGNIAIANAHRKYSEAKIAKDLSDSLRAMSFSLRDKIKSIDSIEEELLCCVPDTATEGASQATKT